MGFPDVIRVEAEGRQGGIWIFWDARRFQAQVTSACSQHITIRISQNNMTDWMLTAVYASPRPARQRPLWDSISAQSRSIDIPWILTGDFNAIRSPVEKSGAASVATLRRCRVFNERINDADLVDLGFSGPNFTWSRGEDSGTYKASRIDRSLCNIAWNSVFPNTVVRHLPRLNSDHNPILTSFASQGQSSNLSRPFKFEAAWLTSNTLLSTIAGAWDSSASLPDALSNLSSALQAWNREVFGNVQQKKRRLLGRIRGIEMRLSEAFHPGLAKLHSKLEAELDAVLEQEELIWYQRSRESWVKFGERNTSYFHQQANIKRRRNKITSLRDQAGTWIDDPQALACMVFDFYTNLYLQDDSVYEDRLPKNAFPRLAQDDLLCLLRPFTSMDIHKAIFEMKPFQAPGPDGFHAAFYQQAWRVVGKALTDMALEFFNSGVLPEAVSESTVVLIPKVDHPEFVTQLRPISLNNVSLKAVTKAITSRLKPVMRKLISPRQSSFIPGRQTTDNVIVVQEVLHSLRKRKGTKGGLILKIDLEKAYDMLRWDFLRDTLKEVGLPSSWIRCIMYCVEQNKMRVLWNNTLSSPITPTRGVRQGDPLSPYLFVLCMERLSHRIDAAFHSGHWKPIRLTRNGPPLTHLFFADDLLLFAEAETRQIRIIKQCLEDFCSSSGQRVNYAKSLMYVSPNVDRSKARLLSERAAIPLKAELGRYLGIHGIHGRVTSGRYQGLLLRIQKKLAPWKAKRLSLAARLTVSRSIISSLPTYHMHTELLPKGVCASIDRINRNFVWGDEEGRSKLHLVGWEKMILPKSQGGVGLRSVRNANLAMLAKSGWRLLKEKDMLWTQVIRDKYCRNKENLDLFRSVQGSSFTWKSFTKASSLLKEGCAWNIKNGNTTKFWNDSWILQEPLKNLVVGEIPSSRTEEVVADMVTEEGEWRIDLFEDLLPQRIQQKIVGVAVDKLSSEEDTLFWCLSSTGRFTAKTAYQHLLPQEPDPDANFWKIIWSLPVPERIRCFMWLVCLGRIATNALLFSRRIVAAPYCPRCNGQVESILHILRDCPPAAYFWIRQVPSSRQQAFFSADTVPWLKMNLKTDADKHLGVEWATFFSITAWLLWKNRNDMCFKGISATLTPPSLAHSILAKVKLWSEAWNAPSLLPCGKRASAPRRVVDIAWSSPPNGWVKLNIDGASNGNPGPAGAGGVLRDGVGHWIVGFVAMIGEAPAALAELWAFFHGLDIAWKSGHRQIEIESDSQLAIQLINDRHDPVHPYATLLAAIRRRISRDWLVRIVHVYREGNRVADWLSKHSLVYPFGLHALAHPPSGVITILQDDIQGVSFERRIVSRHDTSSSSHPPM
ncbi:unnamed protein product [Linum trigynum]